MHQHELQPDPSSEIYRRDLINRFWHDLELDGETGAATWEALTRIREKVTSALARRPPDTALADSLTAKAVLLINGHGS